jgi:hypothetical protein
MHTSVTHQYHNAIAYSMWYDTHIDCSVSSAGCRGGYK